MDRKKFFKSGLSKFIEAAVEATEEAARMMTEISPLDLEKNESKRKAKKNNNRKKAAPVTKSRRPKKGLKYPPGAVENFLIKCTGCGDCIESCPHNAIIPVYNERIKKDIPQMDVNMSPCRMCSDWPCITSCKPKALKPLKKNEMPCFGKIEFIFDFCLNNEMDNPICTACRDICPLGSISFVPKGINFDKTCTACGICIKSCLTFPKALVVK